MQCSLFIPLFARSPLHSVVGSTLTFPATRPEPKRASEPKSEPKSEPRSESKSEPELLNLPSNLFPKLNLNLNLDPTHPVNQTHFANESGDAMHRENKPDSSKLLNEEVVEIRARLRVRRVGFALGLRFDHILLLLDALAKPQPGP